ncbi:MAG: hypothetical protein U0183_18445 [Polyangiaceae bacterium]|jgi:hypothetical protein
MGVSSRRRALVGRLVRSLVASSALVGPCALSAISACGTSSDTPVDAGPPPCDTVCQDETAVRAIRETMKLVYNLTLQGKPVGKQDQAIACPKGGRAYVYGEASSNAEQGTTAVSLTYEAEACGYQQRDDDVEETYDLVLQGKIQQDGVLAVQPGSSTALVMKSESITVSGTIREPAIPYRIEGCKLEMTQNGNRLTATVCGRTVGVDL